MKPASEAIGIDPFHEKLLLLMGGIPMGDRAEVGRELRWQLTVGGPLRALLELLRQIYGKLPPCPPPSRRPRRK